MASGVEALLALEDGSLFAGDSIGASGMATGEVVFNTSMTGYQEILTESFLLPANRRADVSARRQCRRQSRRRGEPPGLRKRTRRAGPSS